MPLLPTGQRVDDPPSKHRLSAFRFRLALAVRKHPVLVALTLALIVLAIPAYLLIVAQGDLRESNRDMRALLADSTRSRREVVGAFCKSINDNAKQANSQTDTLKGMIVGGAQDSKVFEKIYKQYGAPAYSVRVKMARDAASRLEQRKIPVLDCGKYVREIDRQAARVNG